MNSTELVDIYLVSMDILLDTKEAASMSAITSSDVISATSWQASLPNYQWSLKPTLVAEVDAIAGSERSHNFYRTAKWSPDGSAILTVGDDRCVRIFNQPSIDIVPNSTLQPIQKVSYPSSIYSTLWYPSASTSVPGSFCYVVGVSDAPIRLVDGISGKLRASYPIMDHVERFRAPSSMAFSPDATKLYCGHDTAIEVFDFNSPGEEATRLKTALSRRSKDGQKGLISALSFSPDGGSGLFAAGSYAGRGSVCFYTEDTGETPVGELELGSAAGRGVTQINFHPLNPSIVFVASRLSSSIGVYDIRNPTAGPYMCLQRPGDTQQRMDFSVDWGGRWLASGDTDGKLKVWDIGTSAADVPVFDMKVQDDSIGSVSLHPYKPWVLTSAGSRRAAGSVQEESEVYSDSDTDGDSENSEEDEVDNNPALSPSVQHSTAYLRVHSFASSASSI